MIFFSQTKSYPILTKKKSKKRRRRFFSLIRKKNQKHPTPTQTTTADKPVVINPRQPQHASNPTDQTCYRQQNCAPPPLIHRQTQPTTTKTRLPIYPRCRLNSPSAWHVLSPQPTYLPPEPTDWLFHTSSPSTIATITGSANKL